MQLMLSHSVHIICVHTLAICVLETQTVSSPDILVQLILHTDPYTLNPKAHSVLGTPGACSQEEAGQHF